MAQEPSKVDATAYNRLTGSAVLKGIRLVDVRFDMKPEALEHDFRGWKRTLIGELEDAYVDTERSIILGWLRFEVSFRYRRKRVLAASARYVVTYQVNGSCEEDIGRLFVERVGRVSAYPYFRVIIATLASQAGVQLPPLPMISLQPRSLKSASNFQPTDINDGIAQPLQTGRKSVKDRPMK
jgi:hypothetical protein